MSDWNVLQNRITAMRGALSSLLEGEGYRADVIPPTWNNNLRWHVGHLVTSPYILTWGLLGEPLPIAPEYRSWFARGTGPRAWGDAQIPPYEVLLGELTGALPAILSAFEDRAQEPFPTPYTTSLGIELRTPADALEFTLIHDGLHYGSIQALKRGLDGMK